MDTLIDDLDVIAECLLEIGSILYNQETLKESSQFDIDPKSIKLNTDMLRHYLNLAYDKLEKVVVKDIDTNISNENFLYLKSLVEEIKKISKFLKKLLTVYPQRATEINKVIYIADNAMAQMTNKLKAIKASDSYLASDNVLSLRNIS